MESTRKVEFRKGITIFYFTDYFPFEKLLCDNVVLHIIDRAVINAWFSSHLE